MGKEIDSGETDQRSKWPLIGLSQGSQKCPESKDLSVPPTHPRNVNVYPLVILAKTGGTLRQHTWCYLLHSTLRSDWLRSAGEVGYSGGLVSLWVDGI